MTAKQLSNAKNHILGMTDWNSKLHLLHSHSFAILKSSNYPLFLKILNLYFGPIIMILHLMQYFDLFRNILSRIITFTNCTVEAKSIQKDSAFSFSVFLGFSLTGFCEGGAFKIFIYKISQKSVIRPKSNLCNS